MNDQHPARTPAERRAQAAAEDRRRKTILLIIAGAVAIALAVTGLLFLNQDQPKPVPTAHTTTSPTPSVTPMPSGTASAKPSAPNKKTTPPVDCTQPPASAFTPTRITVTGITKNAKVLALPRDKEGTPGTPPTDSTGKFQFGFDAPGVHPGSPAGNVVLDAHTWPDNSAMGNFLLDKLGTGGSFVLFGDSGQTLCYQVSKRWEVSAEKVTGAQLDQIYATAGPPQAVIIVCSGKRTGPGVWTHRTVWFAEPVSTLQAA